MPLLWPDLPASWFGKLAGSRDTLKVGARSSSAHRAAASNRNAIPHPLYRKTLSIPTSLHAAIHRIDPIGSGLTFR